MEQTPFELTPEQKGMLATLSRETGKPIAALIAKALAALQEHERLEYDTSNGHEIIAPAAAETTKPFWKKALEASQRIPEEELGRLPADLAAQVDHYIYGTPKRSVCAVCSRIRSIGSPCCIGVTRGMPV